MREEGGTAAGSRTENGLEGRRRAPFTILRGETHASTHISPLPPTSVCVFVCPHAILKRQYVWV